MIKIAICDDDIGLCNQLENIIMQSKPLLDDTDVAIDIYYSGSSFIKKIKSSIDYDLLFLDIELDETNGIMISEHIRSNLKNDTCQIVFISSKTSYALKLFEYHPLNFLTKPFEDMKVIHSINKTIKLLKTNQDYYTYKNNQTMNKIAIHDILYLEAQNRQVKIVLKNGENILYYDSFSNAMKQVSNHNFYQIHKSYIINYRYVKIFKYDQVKMMNDEIIPISQSYRKSFRLIQLEMDRLDL